MTHALAYLAVAAWAALVLGVAIHETRRAEEALRDLEERDHG